MKVKYDKIGVDYNSTRKADPFLVERLVHHLNPKKGQTFLDIGCGTGNYTIALYQKGLKFTGIDPSSEMLKIASSNSKSIEWKNAKVEDIPFKDNTFDGAIATLTIHHWSDLQKGFREVFRLLNSNGILVVFTSIPKQMEGYWLNHFFPKMLVDSMRQMPKFEFVERSLKSGGFEIMATEKYYVKPDLQDLFLYAGKESPGLYLEEQVRQGISSFSSLAHHTEIEKGLEKLKEAITSGKINEIIKNYENNDGDYLFIIAKKIAVL